MELLLYPYFLLKFWYTEGIIGLVSFFVSLNRYIADLLSLPLFVRTFFKPLKNEYRKGLVRFSIGMGIFVKSVLITVDMFILLLFIGMELLFLGVFFTLPFGYFILLLLLNSFSGII